MQIIFLGTSCAKPTKERNHSAVFLSYGSDGILFDCGEGTQRQMAIAGIKPTKISKVLITHWHGDHVLGLPGLIQTLGMSEYTKTLKIYGPEGTKQRVKSIFDACEFEQRINIEVIEIKNGMFYKGEEYSLESYEIVHGVRTVGYRFVENEKRRINLSLAKKLGIPEGPLLGQLQDNKSITFKGKKIQPDEVTSVTEGKIIAYIPDSIPCENTLKLAKEADLLICDATYASNLQEKADTNLHMTSKQAAQIASRANVKQLVLTHFSTRYKTTHELEEDARDIFDKVTAAKDFMKINL